MDDLTAFVKQNEENQREAIIALIWNHNPTMTLEQLLGQIRKDRVDYKDDWSDVTVDELKQVLERLYEKLGLVLGKL